MATRVDQILEERRLRTTGTRRWRFLLPSLLLHLLLVLGFWLGPTLFARPPEPFEYVDVILIPAARLGIEETPPPEPKRRERQPEPTPPPPKPKAQVSKLPPPAKPPAKDVPVLAKKAEKKAKPRAKIPPPPKAPPPANPIPLPRRKGSREGNPLGISTSGANLGVEDPSFTYDYYIERIRAAISEHWVRPPVGGGKVETRIYFRISQDGKIIKQDMLQTSGSQVFDQAAMRAVAAASPMPPLPRSYKKDHLNVTVLVQ